LRLLSAVCVTGVVASVTVMAITYRSGNTSRAYYGTDTRAHALLIGALLAIVLAVWTPSVAAKRRLSGAAVIAVVAMIDAWHVTTGTSAWYYHGGSAAYAVLACVVIAGALQPGSVRTVLSSRPLAWIGRISYGLYLFHWPFIVWLVPTRVHGLHGLPLNLVRLAATFAAATVSFYLIERPIRERRRVTLRPRTRPATEPRLPFGRRRNVVRWAPVAVGATLAIVLASTTGASPAPNYLAGTAVPPPIVAAAVPGGARGPSSSLTSHASPSTPSLSLTRAAPAPRYVPPPFPNYPWSYGDPLFCGTPRPAESREAVDAAHALGPPHLPQPVTGLRILIVGDSTACSLYPGLKAVGDEVGASVYQAAVFGCGVASGQITTIDNEQITPHTERCPSMVNEAVSPAIFELRPDVVVWMSIWEKADVVVGNQTLVSGTPAADAEMLHRMDAELARLTGYGAKVVVVTEAAPAPNDAQGVGNSSNAVDDASYARLDTILGQFAQLNSANVTVVDLARQVCPTGPPCPEVVNGLRLRPDGRHFTPAAASVEARWLIPRIVDALRH
ncbi:MAG TPA: SGNH hydrolase domain-containing protein, partial [Acidimicrobiia bacterium]|nr:SGNH hydrolase domain-containing protein [Acidimicrobiia bacterium]